MPSSLQLTFDGSSGRLDAWLAAQAKDLSRTRIQSLLDQGAVTACGETLTAKSRPKAGTVIEIVLPDPEPAEPQPEDIPLDILYEDASIIAINKPAGLVVHPAPGHSGGTLVNALLFHCHDLAGVGGVARPGIVHRLDMDTTGVLVVAKTEKALNDLAAQFQSHTTAKRYLALVHGRPARRSGTIRGAIGRHPRDRKKMCFDPPSGGKDAVTHWSVARQFDALALLDVRIETGRTHQIRVHLSHEGMPIVGDPLYGSAQLDRRIPNCPRRQMLHAAEFSFRHPETGETITLRAELPADFKELLDHA